MLGVREASHSGPHERTTVIRHTTRAHGGTNVRSKCRCELEPAPPRSSRRAKWNRSPRATRKSHRPDRAIIVESPRPDPVDAPRSARTRALHHDHSLAACLRLSASQLLLVRWSGVRRKRLRLQVTRRRRSDTRHSVVKIASVVQVEPPERLPGNDTGNRVRWSVSRMPTRSPTRPSAMRAGMSIRSVCSPSSRTAHVDVTCELEGLLEAGDDGVAIGPNGIPRRQIPR
jgi:hypothetical protein